MRDIHPVVTRPWRGMRDYGPVLTAGGGRNGRLTARRLPLSEADVAGGRVVSMAETFSQGPGDAERHADGGEDTVDAQPL